MYRKILIPLDKSKEGKRVIPLVQELFAAGSEGILLHIIPPGRTRASGGFTVLASQEEEGERTRAMAFLMASQLNDSSRQWRCEVAVNSSVVKGIADFAVREEVDLIAMYTHDRKGLAKLIKRSIAEKVQQESLCEVRVFKPRELIAR